MGEDAARGFVAVGDSMGRPLCGGAPLPYPASRMIGVEQIFSLPVGPTKTNTGSLAWQGWGAETMRRQIEGNCDEHSE
jgi:hypothetical protein